MPSRADGVPALQQSGELELRLAITGDRPGQRRVGLRRDRTIDAQRTAENRHLPQRFGCIQRTVILGARVAGERKYDRQSQAGDSGMEKSRLVLHLMNPFAQQMCIRNCMQEVIARGSSPPRPKTI